MIILDLHVFQFKLTLETAITDTQFVVTTTTTVYFNIKLHIHYIKLSYMFIWKRKMPDSVQNHHLSSMKV